MSLRIWRDRIQDILDAVKERSTFLEGMDVEAFRQDARTIKATIANLAIIGEAARYVPETVVQAHPEIPWPLMRGMRNRIVHAYYEVDTKVVWDTCRLDLPTLVEPLERLLATIGPDE